MEIGGAWDAGPQWETWIQDGFVALPLQSTNGVRLRNGDNVTPLHRAIRSDGRTIGPGPAPVMPTGINANSLSCTHPVLWPEDDSLPQISATSSSRVMAMTSDRRTSTRARLRRTPMRAE